MNGVVKYELEVRLARRAFLRYYYYNIIIITETEDYVRRENPTSKYSLRVHVAALSAVRASQTKNPKK